jgi:hypothetical protein
VKDFKIVKLFVFSAGTRTLILPSDDRQRERERDVVRDLCAPQIDNDERYVIRYMVFRCVKNYTVTPGVMILCSESIHTKTHSDSHKRPKNVNQRGRITQYRREACMRWFSLR